MNNCNVVVIGSGISGLSVANLLQEAKVPVVVLEKQPKIGGLIKCEVVKGNLFHRVGGHVFNSKNKLVLEWFWKHFDKENEFLPAKRNAKILLNGKLVGYPIENYLYQLPASVAQQIINELLLILSSQETSEMTYLHFQDFLIKNFGQSLYELYFKPYNAKIWNSDLSKIPLAWLDGKLPMPNIPSVINSNIIRQEESEMVHAHFWYPKENGSQFIVNRLAEGLTIEAGFVVKQIQYKHNQLSINEGTYTCNKLVYCGDVRVLHKLIDIDDEGLRVALNDVKQLVSNGTSNVLCETDDIDLSWLYLPGKEVAAHRIIYTGNFSNTNNAYGKRKSCVVEFSGKQDHDFMRAELKKLPGNLKEIDFNYEANSYIIQHIDTRNKITVLKEQLSKYGISLLGRFAEWEYYNMDVCIEKAMDLVNLLIKQIFNHESEIYT